MITVPHLPPKDAAATIRSEHVTVNSPSAHPADARWRFGDQRRQPLVVRRPRL